MSLPPLPPGLLGVGRFGPPLPIWPLRRFGAFGVRRFVMSFFLCGSYGRCSAFVLPYCVHQRVGVFLRALADRQHLTLKAPPRNDDIADTGKTLKLVRGMLPNAFIATVYTKPNGKNSADLTCVDIAQDTWIVSPWEPK